MTKAGDLEHEEEGEMRQSPEHCRAFALVQELWKKHWRIFFSHENGIIKVDCFQEKGLCRRAIVTAGRSVRNCSLGLQVTWHMEQCEQRKELFQSAFNRGSYWWDTVADGEGEA